MGFVIRIFQLEMLNIKIVGVVSLHGAIADRCQSIYNEEMERMLLEWSASS